MCKIFIILIALFGSVAVLQGQTSADEEAIRNVLSQYIKAATESKGEEAVQYLDTRTEKYYTKMLNLTVSADSAQVATLPFADKLMVLMLRTSVPKDTLLSLNGKGFITYSLNKGLVSKQAMTEGGFSIGKIVIEDNFFAAGQVLIQKMKTPWYVHFYREQGLWKMDLTSILAISNSAFQLVLERSGLEENEFIMMTLEEINKKKPDATMWHPVK